MKLAHFRYSIIAIAAGALFLRLSLSSFGTLELDQKTFIAWGNILAEKGFAHFYENWSDYLPGYLYVLWFLSWLAKILPLPETILFKLPAILADIATGFLIYKIVRKEVGEKWAKVSAGLYFFNPAILANSTLWGQVDSLTALFSMLSVSLLPKRLWLSAGALAVGALIKPQAAFAAPVIIFLMLKNKFEVRKLVSYFAFSFLIFTLGFIPFGQGKNLALFIYERINLSLGQYPYGSVNAFNFWGIFGFWRSEGILKILGPAVAIVITLFSFFRAKKEKLGEYSLLAVSFLSIFLFMTRMHERHLLPALAPLAVGLAARSSLIIPYLGLSVTYAANLYYAYNWITRNFLEVFPSPLIIIFILANLGFLLLILLAPKIKFKRTFLKSKVEVEKFKAIFFINPRILLIAVLVFAALSRFAYLGSPQSEYFDEVYHAFTARRMLEGDPKAWEWWNTPPEGYAFEWTHPPLAKEAMVLGMVIFGENAFGWRAPAALLGTISVFLIYLIAKEIFKDEFLGVLAAGVFALDGLVLVMNRIGMNDTYFLFFALLTFLFFIKNKNSLSALSLGLALASKWSALWLLPILLVAHFSLRKKFSLSYLWFAFLPFFLYLASYLPMFASGHSWGQFIEVQRQMWWYHTQLDATHAYTSPWWSWPLLVRPVYLYTSGVLGDKVANIYALGNPAVFWFGLSSLVMVGYTAFKRKSKNLGLIFFAYVAFFTPWAVSPRIMFLYHYLPSLPFLAIASGYILRKYPKVLLLFFPLAFLLFIYFYPHWAGIEVPVWLDSSYYWFTSWR